MHQPSLLGSSALLRALAIAPVAIAPAASADTIHLTDGTSIEDCQIAEETYEVVEYRASGRKQSIATDKVLRIEYDKRPAPVDRAESAAADEQPHDAIADLETYVQGLLESGKRERYSWAPAYAMYRLIELKRVVGELPAAEAAADRLIELVPRSRFVPLAYLAKADVQNDQGQGAKALSTIAQLEALIQKSNLSRRWALECELSKVLYDAQLSGKKKRDKLAEVSGRAGREYPTVRNRADVAEAETHLEAKSFGEAEKIFQRICDDPKANPGTLAAAFTGLGDCLFQRAFGMPSGSEQSKLYRESLLAFMRVVVVYKDQTRYVPKAMLLAGRIFDQSADEISKEHAQKLYRTVIRVYGGTPWAQEARGFRKN